MRKYISCPELYEVSDGKIQCGGLWSIEIDNHHTDCISVFLGDLGEYLPEREQQYWKSNKIARNGQISEITFKRDFLCLPIESNMEDHKFQLGYTNLNKKWFDRFGWKLFLPLFSNDKYNLTCIRIPLSDSQPEFDSQVLSLVKDIIDSLNEKEISSQLHSCGYDDNDLKGISKLEAWFKAQGVSDYECHIQYLRDLQTLRSAGTGHRKGKEYEKIAKKFECDTKSYIEVFTNILCKANQFILFLLNSFIENQAT